MSVCRAQDKSTRDVTYAIAIHGGAGRWQDMNAAEEDQIRATLKDSLEVGRQVLADQGSSLNAVERVVQMLEDSPLFNAGKGAVVNAEGRHQLDASIMDGKARAAGGVAAISVAKNPISVARMVMVQSRHVLFAGEGADEFARRAGAEIVDPDYFWTEKTRRKWAESQAGHRAQSRPDHYGTVGCVALDTEGNLAAGTSTGGLTGKTSGRVGDSPLIGAGTYADNETCAVSGTGVGELFMRHAIAYDVSARMRYAGQGIADAVAYQIEERLQPGTGGIIAVNRAGDIAMRYNTSAMPRACANSHGRFEVKIRQD